MEPNSARIEAKSIAAIQETSPHGRPRKAMLVSGVLVLAFALYVVTAALWGTTENSFVAPVDLLLWVALPAGLVGIALITAYIRRRAS